MKSNEMSEVRSLLYDEYTNDEIQTSLSQIKEPKTLYVYAYNYNWDNEFEIPQSILNHDECDLSIALLVFYRADGLSYLFDKSYNERLPQWSSFIKNLYDSILSGKYKDGKIEFKVPLSKVELFKLKKVLTEKENVFIEDIIGENFDIDL